jgi:hypothetical protein
MSAAKRTPTPESIVRPNICLLLPCANMFSMLPSNNRLLVKEGKNSEMLFF